MTEDDYDTFAECWGQACCGAGKEALPKAIEWAFEILKDKSIGQIMDALIAHARDPNRGQFVPKPADVIRHIDGSRDDKKDAGMVAWARVLENVDRYSSVVFDDPAIHYAIAVAFGGRWLDVCNFNEDDFAGQEKRRAFVAAYANYKRGMSYPPRLIGITETENSSVDWKSCTKGVGNMMDVKQTIAGGSSSGLMAVGAKLHRDGGRSGVDVAHGLRVVT